MKLKTSFKIELAENGSLVDSGEIKIIGRMPKSAPYVAIEIDGDYTHFVKDADLELLAINILKSLNSKRLQRRVRKPIKKTKR